MADIQKTIEIVFGAVDNTGRVVQGIGGSLSELEGSVGSVTGPLAGMTESILATEAAIIATSLAMAIFSVNAAGDFRTNVSEIGTLFNATSEQASALGDEIITYARSSTASIDEINASVYKAISTGTDYADSVKLVGDAEILATAGRADLASVTALLTSSMNAYGVGVGSAADYSDILFTAVQKGNTTIPELASSLGQVTGIASAAGVPFEDLAAALSALTITSGNTAQSTTILKALLNELLNPAGDLATALDGVTLKGDGLDAVMIKLKEATGGEAAAMSELFGSTEAVKGALALANDNSGAFAASLQGQAERAGAAAAANDVLGKSFESVNQNLTNMIQTTFISAGTPLLDDWAAVAGGLGSIFENLQLSFGNATFTKLFSAADLASADLTETLEGIAQALPAALEAINIDDLLTAFGGLGESISGLFGDLDLTQADDLAEAIQFMIDGVESLTRVSAGIVEAFQPWLEALGELIVKINSTEDETLGLVGQFLGFSTALNTVLPIVGAVGTGLTTLGGAMAFVAGAKALGGMTTGLASLGGLLTGPVGIVAALGASAYAIYDFSSNMSDLNDVIDENTRIDSAWSAAYADNETWEGAVIQMAKAGEAVAHLNEVFKENTGVSIELAAKYGSVSAAQKVIKEEAAAAAEASKEQGSSLMTLGEQQLINITLAEKYGFSLEKTAEKTTVAVSAAAKLATQYRQLTTEQRAALTEAERAEYISALTAEALEKSRVARDQEAAAIDGQSVAIKKETAERLKELELLYDFKLGLEEIASDERLTQLEIAFDFNIAKLESDTKKAVAVIEGLSDTINSTGSLIGELFGYFGDDSISGFDMTKIERQIRTENERRQEALDLQKKMTEAQIRNLEAQTERLADDGALISIEADGLEPELEAFMFKILDKMRLSMTQDSLLFLTGGGQ